MAPSQPQFDCYRLVLVSPRRRILVEKSAGRLSLPQLLVPRWTRAARNVAALIKQKWNIQAVVLDFLGDHPGDGSVVLAEQIDGPQELRGDVDAVWQSLYAIREDELSRDERAVVHRLLDKGSTGRGPFSRLGWTEELLTWLSERLKLPRSQLSEQIMQLNASADAALVRISTRDGADYWFKAAGGSHPLERQITVMLSQQFPDYVPEVVAVHDKWNGWLMRDAGIPVLSSCSNPARLALEALHRLAMFQAAASSHVRRLLAAGCHDHRLHILRTQIAELTPYLEEAMREPGAQPGSRIGPSRLRFIAALIAEATLRLEDIGIPDTLMHCDMGLENIVASARGCAFIDWAQASVGHPFITFHHLRSQIAQHRKTRALIPRLEDTYLHVWDRSLPGKPHRQILRFVPLVALASVLCCRREWITAGQKRHPAAHSYGRVLARQMDLAARQIEEARPLTPASDRLITSS